MTGLRTFLKGLSIPLVMGAVSLTGAAQDTQPHPVSGTTSYDHYPHFNTSYYYGSLDRKVKLQDANMKRYGRNKGRLIGTITGVLAGALIDNNFDKRKGMVLGGITGGIIGQTLDGRRSNMSGDGLMTLSFKAEGSFRPLTDAQTANFKRAVTLGKPELKGAGEKAKGAGQ